MGQGPQAGLLGRLDAFLTEEQRRSPPEDLGRYRLVVGVILFLLALDVVLAVTARMFSASRPRMLVTLVLELSLHPIVGEGGRPVGVTLFGRDVTERKAAEVRLGALHRQLLEASRRAGMAEVATGVLYNVGNTLNSVNVSASLVIERLRGSRIPMLERAVDMLKENAGNPPGFLSEDARGRQLTDYFSFVTEHLAREHAALLAEMQSLTQRVEHVKAVVSMQDGHGFGLHASALAAGELEGRLRCSSEGPGQGATFIIELPLRGQEARA